MNKEIRILIKYRLLRADETLEDAGILFDAISYFQR